MPGERDYGRWATGGRFVAKRVLFEMELEVRFNLCWRCVERVSRVERVNLCLRWSWRCVERWSIECVERWSNTVAEDLSQKTAR